MKGELMKLSANSIPSEFDVDAADACVEDSIMPHTSNESKCVDFITKNCSNCDEAWEEACALRKENLQLKGLIQENDMKCKQFNGIKTELDEAKKKSISWKKVFALREQQVMTQK